MTSSGLLNTGFLWRAIVVSLLLHAFLLLQSPPRADVTPEPPLVAVLRSEVKTQHAETPMAAPSSAIAKNADKRGEASDKPAAPVLPKSIADGISPKAESGAMDSSEAGKSYVFSLAREMRLGKRVGPGLARFTGTSEIRIVVESDGSAAPPQLLKSSGYAELDQAALTMVGAALQRTSVPASLLGNAFDLVLPISFDPTE